MYNKELFDYICNGNIEKSLYNTCIFLIENSKIEILEETFIHVCSYIGTFINIYNINKFNDIVETTLKLINDNNININEYFILITKMCILCDIYNKNPTIKTGTTPILQLRKRLDNVFNEEIKLNAPGLLKFNTIIPPHDSEIYPIALKIITSFVRLLRILEMTSSDNINDIYELSILFRDSFDYIIRKKYTIQTKFCLNDHDVIYFLWGFIHSLYHDPFILNYYKLFNYGITKQAINKTLKNQRVGLIYGCAISVIYSYKRNISSSWNSNEIQILNKMNEISLVLFKQVKKELNIEPEIKDPNKNKKENKTDGLKYIYEYVPKINTNIQQQIYSFEEEYKTICK
jgi:hypothetical protein